MDYGVITEQGDLGLGFEPISEAEKAEIDKRQEENEKEEGQ